MKKNIFMNLMTFLDKLETHDIPYTLTRVREEALLVNVAIPGERWEIEFLTDGSVEVECFRSNGDITDETSFAELFARFAEPANGLPATNGSLASPVAT